MALRYSHIRMAAKREAMKGLTVGKLSHAPHKRECDYIAAAVSY